MYRLRRLLARLKAALFEPALARPVLVLESDDWGAGDASQAVALNRLADLLESVRDADGHPAVMTIGLVSGFMDRSAWAAGQGYVRCTLEDPGQMPILDALRDGLARGVFVIQWHGLEHYWPQSVMQTAQRPEVGAWLASAAPTEDLPRELQSRWTNAARLPSTALSRAEIEAAVAEEAALLQRLFGIVPEVAVPNTFLWTDEVEQSWAAHGVRFVITCGMRYSHYDARGNMRPDLIDLYNGARASNGVSYLVRDVYFEPARGHVPENVVEEFAARTAMGRPCLIETHRFNYLGASAESSLAALEMMLRKALRRFPLLRFASSQEVGDALLARDVNWVANRSSVFAARMGLRV